MRRLLAVLLCFALASPALSQDIINPQTNATALTSGTLPAARLPALTGEVTSSAGSAATTIAAVAWGTYAVTPTCGAGAPTTITSVGASRAIGKTVAFIINTTVTTLNTCTLTLVLTVPFTAARTCAVTAINNTTVTTKFASVTAGATTVVVTNAAVAFPAVNGDTLTISGVCEST